MTPQQIADKLVLVKNKQTQIANLRQARETKELEIAAEYKVKECNDKRSAFAVQNANQIKALQTEIEALNSEIDQLVESYKNEA